MPIRGIHNTAYKNSLARKKQKHFLFFAMLWIVLGMAVLIGGLYLFFFSGVFEIRKIEINGTENLNKDDILSLVNSFRQEKSLAGIALNNNSVSFDEDNLKIKLLAQFPVIKDIHIDKPSINEMSILIEERQAVGVWCMGIVKEACNYFDKEGNLWGNAAKSFGTLLLTVEDKRDDLGREGKVNMNEFEFIKIVFGRLADLGVGIKKASIERKIADELKIDTSDNYYILLNMDSDVNNQLSVFEVFFNEKIENNRSAYNSIDLRIEGRVYYKNR